MKILFLDHDGVICLSPQWGGRFKNKEGLDLMFDRFDDKAVKVLNKIIEETDCEIVVSSDWRLFATLEQMQELYLIRGILKSPIDYTPLTADTDVIPDGFTFDRWEWEVQQSRCFEIKTWLKRHTEITNWVAVDDMNMSSDYKFEYDSHKQLWGLDNFVRTPISNQGIKQPGIKDKIVKILNQTQNM